MSLFTGSAPAIVTPFTLDNKIDFDSLEKHINFLIENNSDAIVACGTTGEASTLNNNERAGVISFIVEKVNKRVPVIAGAGSNNTTTCIEFCDIAKKSGADGLLIVTPYYNKTTQMGLIENYKLIAKTTDLPIIIYNVPSRTGVNIEASTVYELSKISNIIGIKEASGNISQVAEISNLCGNNFDIYAGNDSEILPVLSLGGKGVISTVANIIPKDTHNIIEEFNKGNINEARNYQLNMLNLINALFSEVNPIPVKQALQRMGFNNGILRAPLFKMEDKNVEQLIKEMRNYKLIS